MPCLNKKLVVDFHKMKSVFVQELENIINNEFYYIDVVTNEKKYKIKNIIVKDFKNKINENNIIEKIIPDNHCIHKYKRGNKEGNYCCNKIRTNLYKNDKKDYLCCKHSKKHIPKKRNTKNDTDINLLNENKNVLQKYIVSETLKDDNKKTNYKYKNENKNNYLQKHINKNILENNNINKFHLYNKKKYLKTNIKNSCSNIICKNKYDCIKGNCTYKHNFSLDWLIKHKSINNEFIYISSNNNYVFQFSKDNRFNMRLDCLTILNKLDCNPIIINV